MKKINLIFVLITYVSINTHAIPNNSLPKEIIGIQKDSLTSEMKAEKNADYLQKQLNLTDAQKKKVYTSTLDKVNKMAALKIKYKGNMNDAQAELKPVKSKYDSDMKSIFTDEQYKKWLNIVEAKKVKNNEPSNMNEYDPTILDSQW